MLSISFSLLLGKNSLFVTLPIAMKFRPAEVNEMNIWSDIMMYMKLVKIMIFSFIGFSLLELE